MLDLNRWRDETEEIAMREKEAQMSETHTQTMGS